MHLNFPILIVFYRSISSSTRLDSIMADIVDQFLTKPVKSLKREKETNYRVLPVASWPYQFNYHHN